MTDITSTPDAHTFDSPPLSNEGALSLFAKIDSNPKTLAIFLCHNSDNGHPNAAYIANRACFTSASRIQYKVFFDVENPSGSNPASAARVPSSNRGAFTPAY